MEVFMNTPHGAKLLEAEHHVLADLVIAGETRIHAWLANWLAAKPMPKNLGSADTLAETILAELKGLKHSAKSPQAYRASQAQLAQVLSLALGH